jgi:hypothetical protein
VDPNLLFAGTEFGLFVTVNGGQKWIRLKGSLPTIAVRDLAIQKQENDLAVGTFGRGIYILDDFTPLRGLKADTLAQASVLFPVRTALLYVPTRPYGLRGKGFQSSVFFTANNPAFGATFTYYLKEPIKSRKEKRQEAEKAAVKKGTPVHYAGPEELRAEAEEETPAILLTITDSSGHAVRMLTGPARQGFHRVSWNLRNPAAALPKPRPPGAEQDLFFEEPSGPLVVPGIYHLTLAKRVAGVTTPLAGPQEFSVVEASAVPRSLDNLKALYEFREKVARLHRGVSGAVDAANALTGRLEQIKQALDQTPGAENKWRDLARTLEKRNRDILRALRGDVVLRGRNENTPISIFERVGEIEGSGFHSLDKPTNTQEETYKVASTEFGQELAKLRTLIEVDLKSLENALNLAGAPWTPGRLPEWKEK